MNSTFYEGSGMIVFWILAIVVVVLLYFFSKWKYLSLLVCSIFWPFIVPMIFILKPLKNMLVSGLIGLLLFAYFIVDLKFQLFTSDFYFYSDNVGIGPVLISSVLGENNLVYVQIANNVGLAISMFMIYLFISEKRKNHGAVR
tara:strand:- start:8885 stop:9313 length:429 start_codon:yes stop_codon:yes gene_type:complete